MKDYNHEDYLALEKRVADSRDRQGAAMSDYDLLVFWLRSFDNEVYDHRFIEAAAAIESLQKQLEEARNVIKRIAHRDYRGNRSPESQEAGIYLAALQQQEEK